jgi:hypothetical protein
MTASQLAANQANAQLSTGPVTPEGKAASSRNAISHGLTAKNAMLAGDDPEEYRAHCQLFFERFAHRDEIEKAVIQDIADMEWKLKRIPTIESAILSSGDVRGLATVSMYGRRLRRDIDVRIGTLRKLQAAPVKEEIKNGFVSSPVRPKPLLICGACRTYNEKGPTCDHCGKRHLMTEEEFDYFYPAPQENEQAAAASEALPAAEAAPFVENIQSGTENSSDPIVIQLPPDAGSLEKPEAFPSLLESPELTIDSGVRIL